MKFSIVSITALLVSICLISSLTISFAQNSRSQNVASQILNHQTLILPKSVRNFIILIPYLFLRDILIAHQYSCNLLADLPMYGDIESLVARDCV